MMRLDKLKRIYELWCTSSSVRDISSILSHEGYEHVSKSEVHKDLNKVFKLFGKPSRLEQTSIEQYGDNHGER